MSTIAAQWTELEFWRWPITGAYVSLVLLIGVYGLHRYFLVFHWRKHRREIPRPKQKFEQLPKVTVQLPLYNEGMVAERVIDAVAGLDYPSDRMQIQVLDDSTDGSDQIASQRCVYWRARGIDVEYIHRTDRSGYKAGALANGLKTATGEFVAIFDADFVPQTSWLKRTIHFFTDEKIGMVQTRWDHLNRDDSLLTKSQAIFLDGHFVIEHTARHRSGRWFNFSGTGGVWRLQAIEDAGGWSCDTLTEDMDLSYRSQLAGWNFLFLPKVTCPAELPPEMNAFKSQQHRWTKGTVQVGMKLLPRLLTSKANRKIKTEAFFHLTSPLVYLYINLFVLLFYPAIALNLKGIAGDKAPPATPHHPLLPDEFAELLATPPMINPPPQDALPVHLVDASSTSATWLSVLFGLSLFAMGAMSASVFYMSSQRILKRGWWASLVQIPVLMAVGIGIALNNAIAVVEALVGHKSEFVRTPKYNLINKTPRQPQANAAPKARMLKVIPIPSLKKWTVVIELAFGLYMLQCAFFAVQHGWRAAVCVPFLLLFASGYLYVGFSSAAVHYRTWAEGRKAASLQPA